jgi:transposase
MARSMRHRYTNAMTEGFNTTMKLIQRRAFGLRNDHNQKQRIFADCGKT